jgi:hypothetical protein
MEANQEDADEECSKELKEALAADARPGGAAYKPNGGPKPIVTQIDKERKAQAASLADKYCGPTGEPVKPEPKPEPKSEAAITKAATTPIETGLQELCGSRSAKKWETKSETHFASVSHSVSD